MARITKPCPRCAGPMERAADDTLRCTRCPHREPLPLDLQLRAAGAPQLPGFAVAPRPVPHYPVPKAPESRCKSCGAPIIWTTNPKTGSDLPLSVATIQEQDGVRVAASHFTDCPHAKAWGRKRRT